MKTRTSMHYSLLAVTMAGVLVACAPAAPTQSPAAPRPAEPTKPPAPAERQKMTVWISTSFTPAADAAQKANVEEWAKSKGVDVIVVQESCTVLSTQLNAAIESKIMPDVLSWCAPDQAPKLARLGLSLDVSDLVKKLNGQGGGLHEPGVRAVTTADGKAIAVPTHSATEVFYVRKDLLDAKNLKPPETWAEVVTVAKAITEKGRLWGYGAQLGTASYDAEISMLSMLASYGASPYAADARTPNLNNDATRQVIALIKDMWDAGAIPQDAVTWDDSGNNKAYLTKAAGMIYNTGSVVAAMRKDDADLLSKTTIVPIPAGPKGRILLGYIYGLMISKNTRNPDLAKDLVTYLMDVERQKKFVEAAGTNYMPLYKDLAREKIWDDPINKILVNQLAGNNAVGYPGPTTEWALEAWRTHLITEMMNRVIIDKWDADRAIKEAEEKLVKIYGQFNK